MTPPPDPANERRVTLTFDNGPTVGVTERVVEVLARHAIEARFFAIGDQLATAAGRAAAAEVVAGGHVLGGHTWTHSVPFGLADEETIDRELDDTRRLVEQVGGDGSAFRPYGVGGVLDERLMSDHGARRLLAGGYTCVLWSSVPGDWYDPDGWVDRALVDVAAQQHPVVVLHDIEAGALARLDEFVRRALDLGATFTTETADAWTPVRHGRPTESYELLGVGPAPG